MTIGIRIGAPAQQVELRRIAPPAAPAPRTPCVVTLHPSVDFARAAYLASLEMALTDDEYEDTLAGIPVTERVPPLPDEARAAYADRAASLVMVAHIAGWE